MVYFTADTHFGHGNVIRYGNRPFQTAAEMDETLLRNWNRRVGPEDEIYILGDFTLKGPLLANAYLEKLQGRKYLVRGNHDAFVDRAAFCRKHFRWIRDYYEMTWEGHRFVLCHYPLLSWNGMRKGAFQLHGHQHNPPRYNEDNRALGIARFDVGVDALAMVPVSAEALLRFWEQGTGETGGAASLPAAKQNQMEVRAICRRCLGGI